MTTRVDPKSVVHLMKAISGLSPLTDDKTAFRQWDAKMINALSHLRPGYGKAVEKMKELIDQDRDPEMVRTGQTADRRRNGHAHRMANHEDSTLGV